MSKYDLLVNEAATAVKTPPVPQYQSVTPWGATNPNVPSQQQTFELAVVGVGAVSASAQILVSNDSGPDPSQYNWVPYGDPISTQAGTNLAVGSISMNGSWRHFAAYLTAISGTNASATLRMSA